MKLYKDAELTEEATGTIGGTVYMVLEVKLGKYQKLTSNTATLRIEENYDQHSEAERRWERSVNFESGWQKKDANDEWQTTEATPQDENTSGDDQYFRKVWSWATTSQPLGHNEQHTVEIVKVDDGEGTELSFTPTNDGDDGKNGSESVSADVKNLVITEATTSEGNEDYLVYDSTSENQQHTNPSVTFKFKDDGGFQEGDEYRWTVLLIETSGAFAWSQSDTATEPGSVSVDLTPPYAGVFGFDVWVKHYRDGVLLEGVSCKSLFVKFDDDNLIVNDNNQFEFQYHIAPTEAVSDVNDLSEVNITMLAGDWSEDMQTSGPKTLNPLPNPAHTVILPDPSSNESGEGRVILTGVDSEDLNYRDHKNRRLYPKNDVGPRLYQMLIGSGPALSGAPDSGVFPVSNPKHVKFSGGTAAVLISKPLNTNRSPAAIWAEIAGKKKVSRAGHEYMPYLVTTDGHSNIGSHMISTMTGGKHFHDPNPPFWPAWVAGEASPAGTTFYANGIQYTTTIADYSLTDDNPANLKGISFFIMMGCLNSKGAAAKGQHLATVYTPIAQVISHNRGAGNSMGYQTLTYAIGGKNIPGTSKYIGNFHVGQYWFNAFFAEENLSTSNGLTNGNWAESDYLLKLQNLQIDGECVNPESTPNWGWDSWVITNESPVLGR